MKLRNYDMCIKGASLLLRDDVREPIDSFIMVGPIRFNDLFSVIDKEWNMLIQLSDISQFNPRLMKRLKSKILVLKLNRISWLDMYFVAHMIKSLRESQAMLGLDFTQYLQLSSMPLLEEIPIFLMPSDDGIDIIPRIKNVRWGLLITRRHLARLDKVYRFLLSMEPRYLVFDDDSMRTNFINIQKAFCNGYSLNCEYNCLDPVECLIKCPTVDAEKQIEPA